MEIIDLLIVAAVIVSTINIIELFRNRRRLNRIKKQLDRMSRDGSS